MPDSLSSIFDSLRVVPDANCPVHTVFVISTPPKRADYATDYAFRRAYWSSPWCGRIELTEAGA